MAEEMSRRKFLTNTAIVGTGMAVVFSCPKDSAGAMIQNGMLDKAIEAKKGVFPYRWVRIHQSFQSDKDLDVVRELAGIATNHGLNGIVLSGMDRISLGSPDYLERLLTVKEIANANHLEIIPEGFNTGYGRGVLDYDKNLAEGLLVKDALFVAKDGIVQFMADSPTKLLNADFEAFQGNRFSGFTTQDDPGKKTFVDTEIFHSGRASLRIENFGDHKTVKPLGNQAPPDVSGMKAPEMAGVARIAQWIRVKPCRCYRVSAWVRCEGAEPATLFSIKSFAPDGRDLSPFEPPLPASTGWKQVTTAFNSWYADRIQLNFGVFGGTKGVVWVDDVNVEEVGLMNVIRREGAPLTVRGESTGIVYQEGQDFAAVSDPNLDFQWTHPMPSIQLLPGGRIPEDARLRVSYYHGTSIYNDQVCVCPSEAKVREFWQQQFPLIEKYLAPKRYFLDIDEVRAFNRDESCRCRKMSAAAILGEVTQWLYKQVHTVNPEAEIVVWSDMFDPHHNAVKEYFLVDGSLENTSKYLPADIGIVCWYFEMRRNSLDFFSGHGFKTIGAAYYDTDNLKNAEGWLTALDTTPGAEGIMYTTWKNKYALLAPFGDLVSKPTS
jgi:hypothetical protein